ncbi:MAG: SDR family oxidoreductase [Pseudomonadota bacterium]
MRERQQLVFGASGYIGSHLVPYLADLGRPVRAAARRLRAIEGKGWEGVELMRADALDPASLEPALAGVDVAYYLVHSMAAGRNFGELDIEAARNFANAAETAGVRQIVYLGGLVPEDARSEHIVSRRETGDVLRHGSVPVIELRAGIIVGPGSAAFEVMRDLVFHLPMMITPRWVRAKSPPIALSNLLLYLAQIVDHQEAQGRIFDAAGPEVLTYQEMMNQLAAVADRRPPPVIPVPVLSPKLSSYWLRFVTSVPTNIARALIEGLRHDFTANTAPLEALVPQHLLGFRDSVEAAFQAEREHAVRSRWVEGAFPLRQQRLDYGYYAQQTGDSAESTAPPEAVWKVVASIGGKNRYYYLNILWLLREIMDWMVGGPGLNHRRRDPVDVVVGDRIDSWEVLGVDPGRRLTLAFGMKAPGAGILEFNVEARGDGGTKLTAAAYWHPAGFWGILYWYAMAPAHGVLFRGLTRRICELAEGLGEEHEGKVPPDKR